MAFRAPFIPIIAAFSGVWLWAMLLLSIPWFQRQMLYLHNVTLWWGIQLNKPETMGYLKSQVMSMRIPTSDGERLYAWLIAPLAVYAKHAVQFWKDESNSFGDLTEKPCFKLLANDPEARLIIYFHGNTATLAQGRRTEEYRMISSGADKIFILTFDYRGFGHSTGTPSEQGCINDGIAVINWARKETNITPERIVLLAHSLGTAVATAVAHHFVTMEPRIQFAGLVLCAGFTNATNAFQEYSIGGIAPILGPLKIFPWLQAWFGRRIKDTWKTDERLKCLVEKSDRLRLTLIHATSDVVMPCEQSESLFRSSVQATSQIPLTTEYINKYKDTIDLGDGGFICTWVSGNRIIRKEILRYGGHDTIMKWSPVSLAVLRTFELLET
ncbi:alpha/beta-hydrolase [Lepidopterella palustris CBS 459.81]|uniref:Alpha/beta-hydrolase n=1 Tax=Lepidopterella palustris CBS 459.81 TaxID=1314670 RepID=A0A8E2EEG6_9PEZI|nr:alpha/beta-hydrolase [Lepidopterella palustris CBS 459.81]